MSKATGKRISRRDFVKVSTAVGAGGPFLVFSNNLAFGSQNTLRIAKWSHFVPGYNAWFETAAADWGKQHHTRVIVDEIPVEEIRTRATVEIKSGKGHDVFIFPWSPAEYHQHVIDHAEVYQMVAPRYGAIQQLAHRSTYNSDSKKYFGFADFWAPSPLLFFEDDWAKIGMPLGPVHYGSLYGGGKKLRDQFGIPCGLAFSPTLEGNITLHTMLYAFRAWILDAKGEVLFNQNGFGVQALKYIQMLYQETGTPEQLSWGAEGNVRAMLSRKASCTMNAISLLRVAEKQNPELAKSIMLQPPLIGRNGMGVTALPHITNCSVVWDFAQNSEGAKRFIADQVDNSRLGYEKSLGFNFPIYPKTVPNIVVQLSKDPQANPPYKYIKLKDALHWTPNLGVPGFATPAYMEIFNASVVPNMVASVLKGEKSAEDAAAAGAAEMQKVVDKWKQTT